MNAKTMEGLVGANTNTNLINTPMRVYKDARRRGDLAKMERAMGYVAEFEERAQEYKTKAEEGMEDDAREAKEKAKLEQKEAIQKRKEEQKALEERLAETKDVGTNTDTVEISVEGKILAKGNSELDNTGSDEIKTDAVKEHITYTKSGEAVRAQQGAGISISV